MKCSGLAQERTFSNNYGAAALALFEEFETLDDIANMDLDELTAFIAEKGKNRSPNPEKIAEAVQTAARGSYRLPKTVNDSVNQVLSISVSSIRAMQAQIKALDKEIERQVENIPNTLTSVPGIGAVYSAGILAEIGDINRFPDHPALAKYAGLVWTQHQSGTFEAQHSRLIKSGNHFLKYSTCVELPTLSCVATRSIGATISGPVGIAGQVARSPNRVHADLNDIGDSHDQYHEHPWSLVHQVHVFLS